MLCVAACIDFMGSLLPGGWDALMRSNRQKALTAGKMLCVALGTEPPLPDCTVGSLYPVPLPWMEYDTPPAPDWADPLQDWLWYEHGLEVPVTFIPGEASRILRISAQLYNSEEEYEFLAGLLRDSPNIG